MTATSETDPDEKVELIIKDPYENSKIMRDIRLADAIHQALRVDADDSFVINRENHKTVKSLYDARVIALELGISWS
jgi:hypothetical protein